jgi:putative ATP-binding cassette transporter
MSLIEIVRKEPNLPWRKLALMGVIAGVSNAAILAIIVSAAQNIAQKESSARLMMMFVVATILYAISQRSVFKITVNLFESIVESMRNRISGKIRESELLTLEKLGTSEIYSRLTSGTAVVSKASTVIVAGLQSALIVIFAFLYIGTLSLLAFVLAAVLVTAGVGIYLKRERRTVPFIMEAGREEVRFVSLITHLLHGFTEHKLNRRRSDELYAETTAVSALLKKLRMRVMDMLIANQVFSQYSMYVVMAVIVFVLPRLVPTYHEDINEISATLLFIIGPIGAVVTSFPAYTDANLAIEDIYKLERELDAYLQNGSTPQLREPAFKPFRSLTLQDVEFSYTDRDGKTLFSVGPINFTAKAGETVFIVGGNGSGKSTIFKVLAGLYRPQHGVIKVNDAVVDASRTQAHRELFSSVFGDFHLFDRLYGFNGIDPEVVNSWLEKMQLSHKTKYENGRFTNLDLSSGQKKRLALIVALLEDRPVYLLDEWAAEQDPEFRKYFYTTLLAELKGRGKTVLAISHDEYYFNFADRVVKIDYGKIISG